MTRILVVDDSRFMRMIIGDALRDAGHDVKRVANGSDAIDAVETFDPDVVTMDVEMPGMSGIDAVEQIMQRNPTSIVMLSAHTERGADATLDALERGAVDFIHKPDGSGSRNIAHLVDDVTETIDELTEADVSSQALVRAVAAVSKTSSERPSTDVSTGMTDTIESETPARSADGPASSTASTAVPSTASTPDRPDSPSLETVANVERTSPVEPANRYCDDPTIIIGASTGGPKIVEQVLGGLPLELDAKIIVVQHMPPDFTARFASRLDDFSAYQVREAQDGDRVVGGEAVIARGDVHLEVTNNVGNWLRVRYDDGDSIHGVRPAIDVTMKSAADRVTDPLTGVALTGMGRDGAAGIRAIKQAGGRTIAQDEQTSPVFGIPEHAIETGCVDDVVPASDVVDAVLEGFDLKGENDG